MAILVVCPGCKKSFQVNDKFAGKTGPCPKCKTTIKIPEKAQEVKIHGGEDFSTGGRTVSGKLALKPIAREKSRFQPKIAATIGGAAVGLLIVSWIAGKVVGDNTAGRFVLGTLGLLLLSPVLAVAAYTFLREDELEPYRGKLLYIRSAVCAAVYVVLWATFAYVRTQLPGELEIWQWFVVAGPFLVVGGMAAWLSLDLEPGNGFFHYAFYLVVTVFLGLIAGFGL